MCVKEQYYKFRKMYKKKPVFKDSMPKSVSRHIQFMLDYHNKDLDIKLFPIVLTQEQVINYGLPTSPVKDVKDGASLQGQTTWEGRRQGWIRKFGDGNCELDALEAIYPGELEKIIKGYILNYYDETIGWLGSLSLA